ncbi:MAG: hypothetical protein KKG25_06745 [Bacteroidetes bacterium]|nr:hypothetical protein [Bacteroidota bacterium]MBU1484539.1 hypothetical protein [Bacteroidota bacterium]MBU2374866.1 hypothetical protein [Bacteroidota bacterium]
MKNLELEGFELVEMKHNEIVLKNGGMGYDAGGYGLAMNRSGEARFYGGFLKGLYDAFFN